jgi:hypothetical protein
VFFALSSLLWGMPTDTKNRVEELSTHHFNEGVKARVEVWAILRKQFKFEFPRTQKSIAQVFVKK